MMMWRALIIYFLFCTPAISQSFISGKQLLDDCKKEYPGICVGYILGTIDWAEMASGQYLEADFCIPSGLTSGEIKETVVDWMDKNQSALGFFNGSGTVVHVLNEAFPC